MSGLPLPSPGDFSNPGIEPGSPALQADSLPTELNTYSFHSQAKQIQLEDLSGARWNPERLVGRELC